MRSPRSTIIMCAGTGCWPGCCLGKRARFSCATRQLVVLCRSSEQRGKTMSQHPARALLSAAIVLAVGGCNGTGQPKAADADSVKQAMKADEKAWNAQFNAKPQDLEAL